MPPPPATIPAGQFTRVAAKPPGCTATEFTTVVVGDRGGNVGIGVLVGGKGGTVAVTITIGVIVGGVTGGGGVGNNPRPEHGPFRVRNCAASQTKPPVSLATYHVPSGFFPIRTM